MKTARPRIKNWRLEKRKWNKSDEFTMKKGIFTWKRKKTGKSLWAVIQNYTEEEKLANPVDNRKVNFIAYGNVKENKVRLFKFHMPQKQGRGIASVPIIETICPLYNNIEGPFKKIAGLSFDAFGNTCIIYC